VALSIGFLHNIQNCRAFSRLRKRKARRRQLCGAVSRSHKLPGRFPRLTAAFFFFCARRAAWQTSTADPSLPVGAALCFSVWRLFDKRKKRAPEGGDLGRSLIWGAVGVTLFGLFLGSLVRSWVFDIVNRDMTICLACFCFNSVS
jgi:hypothetical protein